MDIEQLIRENIANTVHMSLGTSRDNRPWVCEVHFAYDDDLNLYFRSLASRRHSREIADNPRVAGNIVRQFALGEMAIGVYFEGAAEKLAPGPEQDKAFACLQERLKATDSILEEAKDPEGHQFYKISVDTFYLFGKFDEGEGRAQKYELAWNGKQAA
jgi:uncharacterized protein YhbP (UPF0306 family)